MLGGDRVWPLARERHLGQQLALALTGLAGKHRLPQGGAMQRQMRAGAEIAVSLVLVSTVAVGAPHVGCSRAIKDTEAGGMPRLGSQLLEHRPRPCARGDLREDRPAYVARAAREPILAMVVLL